MPRQSDSEPAGRAVGPAIATGPAEELLELQALAARRLRVALWLTGAMLVIYFGFILLVAFAKPLLGRLDRAGAQPRDPARRARDRGRLGRSPGSTSAGPTATTTPARAVCRRSARDDRDARRARTRSRSSSSSSFDRARRSASRCWAARRTRTTEQFYAAGRSITGVPERPGAGRRLHERRQLPRHRRARVALRVRRAHLLDRLSGRLADRAVPDRRAVAQPRQVHLRRRRRLPACASAGAHRRRHRNARRSSSST